MNGKGFGGVDKVYKAAQPEADNGSNGYHIYYLSLQSIQSIQPIQTIHPIHPIHPVQSIQSTLHAQTAGARTATSRSGENHAITSTCSDGLPTLISPIISNVNVLGGKHSREGRIFLHLLACIHLPRWGSK